LLYGVGYTVSITTGPSLAFPVKKEDNPKISSFWGVDRDGGRRSHEGIDIFAKRNTPLLAAADGIVTRVNENTLGGKVIFMRPSGKDYSLYYAHLDQQLVKPGQNVRTGEVVGLMGNTGNAKTTSPHLHFGIYTSNGAVDPLPFVKTDRPAPKVVKGDEKLFNENGRILSNTSLKKDLTTNTSTGMQLQNGSVIKILGAADNMYKVSTPAGDEGFVTINAVSNQALRKQNLKQDMPLYDQPSANAAVKKTLKNGSDVLVKGTFNDFLYVSYEETDGWIMN
jgi:hypothetical protein